MMKIDFHNKKNEKCLEFIKPFKKGLTEFSGKSEFDPEAVQNVYLKLGMHEEVTRMFWDEITTQLPQDCRWIVHGRAALVNPNTGIIFGFIFSNITFALRLSANIKKIALSKCGNVKQELFREGVVNVEEIIGDEWVLVYAKDPKDIAEFCADAYHYSSVV